MTMSQSNTFRFRFLQGVPRLPRGRSLNNILSRASCPESPWFSVIWVWSNTQVQPASQVSETLSPQSSDHAQPSPQTDRDYLLASQTHQNAGLSGQNRAGHDGLVQSKLSPAPEKATVRALPCQSSPLDRTPHRHRSPPFLSCAFHQRSVQKCTASTLR